MKDFVLFGFFADATRSDDPISTRSMTGSVNMYLCAGPLCWRSAQQLSIAMSSVEAEYMALAEACKTVMWLRQLIMKELRLDQLGPTIIEEDNQGAIQFFFFFF